MLLLSCLFLSALFLSSCSAGSASTHGIKDDGTPDQVRDAGAKAEKSASDTKDKKVGAFGGSLDGQLIYEKACASCHANGFNGAPRLVASDWPHYKDLGVDHYTYSAIQGIGIMPARGGQPELLDEQVRQAVEYMLQQLDRP
ncbi:hypothetical protein JCM17846_18760 [Iodidimonas nitroreducens]|uniref:Cytochrome c domain-containing protein n=1 Tax=Iodidimonas nitroreducens TaxID=1236968 RepID=A0A5A7N8V6_9PROT|nr:hypothetical protein JCM17846_18760 [Iodidimonas nitroreducens]